MSNYIELPIQMHERDYEKKLSYILDQWTTINFNMIRDGDDVIANHLKDADNYIIDNQEITIMIDYPLADETYWECNSEDPKGWTPRTLLKKIMELYKQIYKEEEETMDTPIPTLDKRGGLWNRPQSTGRFGIWGHDIEDLYIEGVYYDHLKHIVHPSMGS